MDTRHTPPPLLDITPTRHHPHRHHKTPLLSQSLDTTRTPLDITPTANPSHPLTHPPTHPLTHSLRILHFVCPLISSLPFHLIPILSSHRYPLISTCPLLHTLEGCHNPPRTVVRWLGEGGNAIYGEQGHRPHVRDADQGMRQSVYLSP